ncbi:MAG TPA: AAA family ATPase, partial [Bryobacteraceae bacterium]|nr:AAA family ATPase [Bryobacteraceae bacterium]
MRLEVSTAEEIGALATAWGDADSREAGLIHRIEDLPHFEELDDSDIEWVVEGLFAERALHMLTSESGAGKSTFTAAAGHAISLGRPFLGRATSKRPVLILDAENPKPAIRERFRRLEIQT